MFSSTPGFLRPASGPAYKSEPELATDLQKNHWKLWQPWPRKSRIFINKPQRPCDFTISLLSNTLVAELRRTAWLYFRPQIYIVQQPASTIIDSFSTISPGLFHLNFVPALPYVVASDLHELFGLGAVPLH